MDCPRCQYKNADGALTCNLCGELLRPKRPSEEIGESDDKVYSLLCFPFDPTPVTRNNPLTIGRSKGNDMVLPVGMVSREHAEVTWNGEAFEITDLGSSNGTYVNDTRVRRQALKEGDRIRIGPYEIRFKAMSKMMQELGGGFQNDLEMTQNIVRRDLVDRSSTFSGRIGEMRIDEVFQLIDFNKKTGTLELRSSGDKGAFHFREGQILAADFQGRSGMHAMAQALSLKEGSFEFHAVDPKAERVIKEPTAKVLLDAMRMLDEQGR